MTEHITITKSPDTPETLDFQALLDAGIKAAQQFSGAEWTDYNAHDPGVTILETLVFALTDIAYRTQHPTEDILASSAATADPDLVRQPFFPGPQAFASAPVTANDYRKLLYDQITGLRNAWILPHADPTEPAGAHGQFDVWIQPYATDANADPATERTLRKIEDAAAQLLRKVRALGVDFRHVRIAPCDTYAVRGDITLAPEADPNAALAELLYAAETALNPPPKVEDLDTALAAGARPETLFEGPTLEVGLIRDTSLRAPGWDIDLVKTRASILALPEIETIHGLTPLRKSCPLGCDAPGDTTPPCTNCKAKRAASLVIPTMSRDPDDLLGLRLFRRGGKVEFETDKVMLHLRHIDEKVRWDEQYGIRRVAASDYARVRLGNPDRQLARYRSIQHMFPATYGIGPNGAHGSAPLGTGTPDSRATRQTRQAEARQLKAYLALFEQMLANHLAQLDATADLLALPSDAPSYQVQPLTRPAPTPDDAPALGTVLGQPEDPRDDRDHGWFDTYTRGLAALRDADDIPLDRRGRALDHLLARFGERIDTVELKRLYDDKTAPLAVFGQWLLDRKAALLRDVITLGQGRGQGVDLSAPETCPLVRRIALRSGHDAPMWLVEHVLLRDDGLDGRIGTEEIGSSFAISAPLPHSAVRVALGDPANPGLAVHWVVDPDPPPNPGLAVHWVMDPDPPPPPAEILLPQLCVLGADPAHYTVTPRRGYGAVVRIAGPDGLSVDVVENFQSISHAWAMVDEMVATCSAALDDGRDPATLFAPIVLPLDFAARGATLVLAPDAQGSPPARRAYLADIVAEEMPAHTLATCLWLESHEVAGFRDDYNTWCKAQLCVRATSTRAPEALAAGSRASQTLRRHIHDLFCRAFRSLRAGRRDTGSGAAEPSGSAPP